MGHSPLHELRPIESFGDGQVQRKLPLPRRARANLLASVLGWVLIALAGLTLAYAV